MSTVLEPTIDTIDWDDLQPPCEATEKGVQCPQPAEWVAENLACSCDPAPYTACSEHKEYFCTIDPMMCARCRTRADLRWEKL